MDQNEVETIARKLMDLHGLTNWKFSWMKSRNTVARCQYSTKTISFSTRWAEVLDEYHVSQTMLHEIAHALVGHKPNEAHCHHGAEWKAKARSIGYVGKRLMDSDAPSPKGKYTGVCPNGHETSRDRMTRSAKYRQISCHRCSNSFDRNYLFTWYKTEDYQRLGKRASSVCEVPPVVRAPRHVIVPAAPQSRAAAYDKGSSVIDWD